MEQFLGRRENRYPDGVLIKNRKMIFFEYDGAKGHGNVFNNLKKNKEKDIAKNELYQEIANKAQNGEIKGISDVLVLRIRAQGVPMLNTQNNVFEINENETADKVKNVENALYKMMKIIDDEFGWNMTQDLSSILNRDNIKIICTEIEISRLVGFGTQEDRCGPFVAMPKKINFNIPTIDLYNVLDNQPILIDFGKTYLQTKNRQFNNSFKNGTMKFTKDNYPKLYDHASGAFFTEKEMDIFKIRFDNATMSYDEIKKARVKFPQQINSTKKEQSILANYVKKSKQNVEHITNKETESAKKNGNYMDDINR